MMRTMTTVCAVFVTASMVLGQAGGTGLKPVPLGSGKGVVTLSWDEFVKITGYDPARKGGQTLTIPWTEVEKLLGTEIQVRPGLDKTTVDLPWNEFKALLQWSLERKNKETAPPPMDFVVTGTQYIGEISGESATFTLKAKVDILRKTGWKQIAILPATVALTKSELPEGWYVYAAGNGYVLLTDKTGSQDITLKFTAAVNKFAGVSRINFPRLTPGASVLDLKVSPGDVEVKVAGAQSLVSTPAEGKVNVMAALPSGMGVDISWERALPKVEAVPTKLYAETGTLVAVSEGVLLCQETINYNILHTGVRELKLQAPAGVSVLEVAGANLQDWRAAKDGAITVVLRGEALGPYSLRIAYEMTSGETVQAPVIRTVGAEREKGYIGVVALANVEIDAGEVAGATQIDVRQLPVSIVSMTNQPVLLAFRYMDEKFSVPLAVKKHEQVDVLVTIADSALFTAMQLDDGRRITKVIYSVRNNRNQFLRLKMPAKAEIWSASVAGNTVSPAKEGGNVLIPLVRSGVGSRDLSAFPVELVYVETPDKVAPESGKLRVELPTLDAPAMQVMYNFYAPAEGKYTIGWGASGFSGPMRLVESFTNLAAGPGAAPVVRNVAQQAKSLQRAVDARVDAQARAAGAQPVRVQLPVNGTLFRLERILALPKDSLWFEVQYRGWQPAR